MHRVGTAALAPRLPVSAGSSPWPACYSAGGSGAVAQEQPWLERLDAALAAAREQRRVVLVDYLKPG